MEMCKKGYDRQEVHSFLRSMCQNAADKLRKDGELNPLWEEMGKCDKYKEVVESLDKSPRHYIGRAPMQVVEFLLSVIAPLRRKYPESMGQMVEMDV